ncbi:MAG: alpha-1,4-glucan--maltose-1-phosphate maltosyltransferase [Thermodesulfobacteriota bacterium]|nr:alpha-1,4-glucan--maltose-1-phosphate maltosyltransferase [Thermodesulfobacteriota bacterium]
MKSEGKVRVVIENVNPEIDCGRFPAKRVVGQKVSVSADIFVDGHSAASAVLMYKGPHDSCWQEAPMRFQVNDQWNGEFHVEEVGSYVYTIEGWVNHFRTWLRDIRKKIEAHQDVAVDLLVGVGYIEDALKRAKGEDAKKLKAYADLLRSESDREKAIESLFSDDPARLMDRYPDRSLAARYPKELPVVVDREKAMFSTWYECFPRSCSNEQGKHGTFRDCERLLPELSRMGFDVLYFPPIHPIGVTKRKGKNNSPTSLSDDVGSPWAIGSKEGGHKSVHPQLGTMEDFEQLVRRAKDFNIEIAMDLAFQCSPDHPYVKEHPEWFQWRPDRTVQYAENPPKKYEDVLPLDFGTGKWGDLWEELKSIVVFWIQKGIRIFRVDNPHTKPFSFWEWLIAEIKKDWPDVIFLSEAFTRPKVMRRLAKLGFSQSYTYFTWRNTKQEFTEYLTELTQAELKEYMRPNFWPNTPDILPEHLQYGGRPSFIMRLILAATLSSNYGVYGPAFELCINEAVPGKEEYLNSEKYEIRAWDWNAPGNLKDYIARINTIRRENPALRRMWNLRFYDVENDCFLFYGKATEDLANIILVVITLDPVHTQSGRVRVPIDELGIEAGKPYLVHDLLSEDKFIWHGEWNYIELNPQVLPGRIFRVRKRMKREMDFDYFM